MPTLNYDPTEADMPEFSEEEQDSLKVGEQAFAEQERMLAGKFNDPAEPVSYTHLTLPTT